MIIQGRYKIISNKKVGPDYFKMLICAPNIAQQARPGQFVHLRCTNSSDLGSDTQPLLRRPFSFHRFNQNNFEILYKVVGQGTRILAKKRQGERIDVLGPLGNGFDIKPTSNQQRPTTILVAGGMGVAPLLALAEKLVDANRSKILVLIGAKTKKAVLCARGFRKLGAKVRVATEDGSQGFKGLVTKLLKDILPSTINYRLSTIYACGPKSMLQEIAGFSDNRKMPTWACLEENLACGLGACLGCAIKTQLGYKRVCKDGPVFKLQEIVW